MMRSRPPAPPRWRFSASFSRAKSWRQASLRRSRAVTLLFTVARSGAGRCALPRAGRRASLRHDPRTPAATGNAIRHGGGAVIKTVGEGVLASFSQVTAAVETALSLPARINRGAAARHLPCASAFTKGRRWPRRSTTSSTISERPSATPSASSAQARDGELLLTRSGGRRSGGGRALERAQDHNRGRADCPFPATGI